MNLDTLIMGEEEAAIFFLSHLVIILYDRSVTS